MFREEKGVSFTVGSHCEPGGGVSDGDGQGGLGTANGHGSDADSVIQNELIDAVVI